MNSRELLYVKTVARAGTISKAAQELFVAQPSLSQSIQRIEESLGVPLFNRTASGLTLTYAGERYCQMASQILKIYGDFEAEVSEISNLKTGRVHLGITNHLGVVVISQVLPEFHQLYPGIEVFVSEENTATLEQKLLTGELDFAIMHAPAPKNSQPLIQYDTLKDDPFVIVLSRDHPLNARALKSPQSPYPVLDLAHLKDEPFLMLHKQQRIRQITDAAFKRAGLTQPKVLLTLRNYETAQALAARGFGLTLLPSEYAALNQSRFLSSLLSVPPEYGAKWSMCISTLKSGFLSRADQMFIQLVKERFSAD